MRHDLSIFLLSIQLIGINAEKELTDGYQALITTRHYLEGSISEPTKRGSLPRNLLKKGVASSEPTKKGVASSEPTKKGCRFLGTY